jgi:hypothetical protein
MSTENTPISAAKASTTEGNELLNPFLPIFLFACGFLVFLGWQIAEICDTRSLTTEAITQREAAVTQSLQIKERLDKVALELFHLSKTNSEARKLVAQYNIQFTPKSGEATAGAETAK